MKRIRRSWALARPAALGLGAAIFLASCAGDDPGPPPCPSLVVVKDAAKLTRFQGGGRDLTDVVVEAEILEAQLACPDAELGDEEVEGLLQVLFSATRGPAELERKTQFSYFVAIADSEQNILAREEFDLQAEFPGNRTEVKIVEEIEPNIPLAEGKNGWDYVVYLGLVLNRAEVDFNRRNQR